MRYEHWAENSLYCRLKWEAFALPWLEQDDLNTFSMSYSGSSSSSTLDTQACTCHHWNQTIWWSRWIESLPSRQSWAWRSMGIYHRWILSVPWNWQRRCWWCWWCWRMHLITSLHQDENTDVTTEAEDLNMWDTSMIQWRKLSFTSQCQRLPWQEIQPNRDSKKCKHRVLQCITSIWPLILQQHCAQDDSSLHSEFLLPFWKGDPGVATTAFLIRGRDTYLWRDLLGHLVRFPRENLRVHWRCNRRLSSVRLWYHILKELIQAGLCIDRPMLPLNNSQITSPNSQLI
jgi:hypothetical protein